MFEAELNQIQSEVIRGFTSFVLSKVNPEVWTRGASSTNKYHPQQSLGPNGMERHVRSAFYFGAKYCDVFDVDQESKDVVLAAILLHDGVKFGLSPGKWTTKTHAPDMAKFILAIGKHYPIDQNIALRISAAVARHMGRYEQDKPSFPADFTVEQQIVHLADVTSAQKEVHLYFLETDSFVG